jgi:LPXTG-motif cell wall-anchored protein
MRLRRSLVAAVTVLTTVVLVGALPAAAHDHRAIQRLQEKHRPYTGEVRDALKGALKGKVNFAAATPGKPEVVPFTGELTELTSDPMVEYPSPTDTCAPESCAELQVNVPEGMKSLYASIGWQQQSYYLVLWAISPDNKLIGRVKDDFDQPSGLQSESTENRYDKRVGNMSTIPKAQLSVADPAPGMWRIRAQAVFGNKVKFDGLVAVSADPVVQYQRKHNRQLADELLTQHLRVNVVFAGREFTKDDVATLRDQLPDKYYPSVITKTFSDCSSDDNDVDCQAGTLVNWHGAHYSGTQSSADDEGEDRGGRVPYFEALRWNYSYRFFQAADNWTHDLFEQMGNASEMGPAEPVSGTRLGAAGFLAAYHARAGIFRGAEGALASPATIQKIDPYPIEDWIMANRFDKKYQFTDIESGVARDGAFINPDPTAYYDPFYDAKGTKNLDRMPQGPVTSVTYFVLDTYTSDVAREFMSPSTYHAFDVAKHMIDPDTDAPDSPYPMRLWGGRYRFFMYDLGAAPNGFETPDWTERVPYDSAGFPDGDPPIWEIDNNPLWGGWQTNLEKISRMVRTGLAYRFTASYLYRPRPADVIFVSTNNWSDYYSRPEGGGLRYTDLTKLYDPGYVSRNFSSVLPYANFTTEANDPNLRTFRYLGCSSERAGTAPEATSAVGADGPTIMSPDPSCPQGDKYQRALEEAKAQGDDVAGAGVQQGGVSAGVVRAFVEENRDEIAPFRPNQLTITNISVVFPGVMTWTIPVIVGGIAFGTPNSEAWGVLQNTNERSKPTAATDCSKSPAAPECNGVPPEGGLGFSYVVTHESAHFVGLTHPHDSTIVEKNEEGEWDYYKDQLAKLFDFSQAPTTYAGAFAPYSVIDQDIVQRGHAAEYVQMAQDLLFDAYLQDGIAGSNGPSEATMKKVSEVARWEQLGSRLLACGDLLHAEYAMRNAFFAAQGIYGPEVEPKLIAPGEVALFKITPQAVYGPDGPLTGCATVTGASLDPGAPAPAPGGPTRLPATGGSDSTATPLALLALAALGTAVVRRRRRGTALEV